MIMVRTCVLTVLCECNADWVPISGICFGGSNEGTEMYVCTLSVIG